MIYIMAVSIYGSGYPFNSLQGFFQVGDNLIDTGHGNNLFRSEEETGNPVSHSVSIYHFTVQGYGV